MKRVPPLPVEYSLLFEIDLSSDIAGHTINEAVPGMHLPQFLNKYRIYLQMMT